MSMKSSGSYGDFVQRHTYQDAPGILLVPRTTGAPKIVRLHAAYSTRVVEWNATRNERPPEIPKQGDLGSDTYLGGSVSMPLPIAISTGEGYAWSISGTYVYVTADRKIADGQENLTTGKYPFETPGQDAARAAADTTTTSTIPVLDEDGNLTLETVTSNDESRALVAVKGDDVFPWPFTHYPKELVNGDLVS